MREVPLANLVKLVNQTHPFISQYQRPCHQSPLPGQGAPLHIGSETNSRSTLTSCENWSGSYLLNIYTCTCEEL